MILLQTSGRSRAAPRCGRWWWRARALCGRTRAGGDVSAAVDEEADGGRVAVVCGEVERRLFVLVSGCDVGAAVEEELCDGSVAVEGGPVQRRAAVLVLDCYIGALLN